MPLSASVKLTPVEWGTHLELECSYADATDGGAGTAWSYGLYVTGDDGTTSELSTWKIAPGIEGADLGRHRARPRRHPHGRDPADRERRRAAAGDGRD